MQLFKLSYQIKRWLCLERILSKCSFCLCDVKNVVQLNSSSNMPRNKIFRMEKATVLAESYDFPTFFTFIDTPHKFQIFLSQMLQLFFFINLFISLNSTFQIFLITPFRNKVIWELNTQFNALISYLNLLEVHTDSGLNPPSGMVFAVQDKINSKIGIKGEKTLTKNIKRSLDERYK